MTPETIETMFDIVLFSILGITFFKALLGFKRGVWKGLCSLLVSGVLYAMVIVLNTKITSFIYQLDLSSLAISFSLDGNVIELNTIGQLIRDVIMTLAGESIELDASSKIFQIFDALAMSIVAFIVFIVDYMIVAFIAAPFISWLVYKFIVRPVLGKTITKKFKLRFFGFFVYGIKAFVTCALLIAPFSALTNSIAKSAEGYDFSDNEQTEIFGDYIDAYNNSYFAKAFSTVKVGDESIDVVLTDYVTSFDVNGQSTSFLKEAELIFDIAFEGVEQGVIDLSNFTIQYSNLISKEFVTTVLQKLASSQFVTTLLPVAISIVVNLDEVKDMIDLTEIEWDQIDWSDELNALGDIYAQFEETGIIKKYVIEQEDFQEIVLDREYYNEIYSTFLKLNESQVLKEVLPYVMLSFANYVQENTDFKDVLPLKLNSYKNIDLGKELCTILDAVINLSDLARYAFDGNHMTIRDLSNQETMKEAMNFILSDQAINGEENPCLTSDSIENTGREPIKITTESIFNGVYNGDEVVYAGLLDSSLINRGIDNIVEYALNLDEIKKYDLGDEIRAVIKKLNTPEEWKEEIANLLPIIPIVYNNEKLPLENLDIFDETQVNELKKLTTFIDKSVIIKDLADPLIKKLMKTQDFEIYGLTADDLNFDLDNLGEELGKLLDLLPKIGDLRDGLTGGVQNILDANKFNINDVKDVLVGVYNSEILNSKKVDSKSDELNNFETLILNIFQDEAFADFGISVDKELLLSIRNSDGGWDKNNGEISRICAAFSALQDATSLHDLINNDSEQISISSIKGEDFENVVSSLAESRLIEPSMGKIFNKYIQPAALEMSLKIDFENVENWSYEAEQFAIALDALGELENSNISFEDFNIASLDSNALNNLEAILRSIASLESINSEDFGEFVYNNITETAFGDYLKDDIATKVKADHMIREGQIRYDDNLFVSWADEEEADVISDIMDFLDYVINASDEDNPEDKWFFSESNGEKTLDIQGALTNVDALDGLVRRINKIYIFRSLLSEILNNELSSNGSISLGDINFEKANLSIFEREYNFEYENSYVENRLEEINARQTELDHLMDIFEQVDNLAGKTDLESFKNTNLTETIGGLLEALHNSQIFNKNRPEIVSKTTIFEDVVKYILDTTTMSEQIYDPNNSTLGETQDDQITNIILTISREEILNVNPQERRYQWVSENGVIVGEIDKFVNLLNVVTSFENFSDMSETSNLSSDNISDLMNSLNESFLTHNALANIVDDILGDKIEKYDLEDNIDVHYIDYTYSTFEEKVNSWKKDIVHLVALYDELQNTDFDDLIGGTGDEVQDGIFKKLLPHIGQLECLGEGRSDVIYGIFDDAEIETYISQYGDKLYDTSEHSLETFRRRDMVDYLIENRLVDWDLEAERLDILVNVMLSQKDMSLDEDDSTIDGEMIYDIIESTYIYDENHADEAGINYENYYRRGYFASEIVSTFLNDMMIQVNVSDMNWRTDSYTYIHLNRFEAEGFEGLLDTVINLSDFSDNYESYTDDEYNAWESNFLLSVNKMGNTSQPCERLYYLDGFNSIAATKLFNELSEDSMGEVDSIIEDVNTSIALWNAFNPNDQIEEVSIGWQVDEDDIFSIKGIEWAVTFRKIHVVTQTVGSI